MCLTLQIHSYTSESAMKFGKWRYCHFGVMCSPTAEQLSTSADNLGAWEDACYIRGNVAALQRRESSLIRLWIS